MGLNNRQIEAVNCVNGPLLILAGAGSGKTTVLINRIYHLINDLGVSPYNILAITFTNKAADELKNRLNSKLGDNSADIWACTFHSCCVRILRRNSDLVGYDKSFGIYDTSDSTSIIKQILKDMDIDDKIIPVKKILTEISNAKDKMILPYDYSIQAKSSLDFMKEKIAKVYAEYDRILKQNNAMDFDDLILNTVLLLKNNEEIRNYWTNRFRYLMIDEYQDTNKLQYMLASLLTGKERNICVVGDDDQSIYKFRGATIENILNFEQQFDNCKVIRLEQNYRSTGHILNAANSVIKNNSKRKGKNLWTNRGEGDRVEFFIADNQEAEASYITSVILNGYSHGANWRDYAVLYRMNAQSNAIEYAFKRNAIPYRIIGGTRFFDRMEVKDIISYLHVINNHNDNLRLQRIINTPLRGIGNTSVNNALDIANRNNISLYEVISHSSSYPELSKTSSKFKMFCEMIDDITRFAQNNSIDYLFDYLIEKTGYIANLEIKNTQEDITRIENVKELKSTIISYMNETDDESLSGYLENVSLYSDLDNYDNDGNAVILMTIHSSKGLEFPNVFITGMEETIFPGIQSMSKNSELEEERRLCYVAITRAMNNLYLISAKQRMLFGQTKINPISRFVDEISDDDMNRSIPKKYSNSSYGNINAKLEDNKKSENKTNSSIRPKIAPVSNNTELECNYVVGQNVKHKAFGKGVITEIREMSGDYLISIEFEKIGKKSLLFKTAGKFISPD